MVEFVPDHVRAKQYAERRRDESALLREGDPDAMARFRSTIRLRDASIALDRGKCMIDCRRRHDAMTDARDLYYTALDAWRVARGLV